MNPITRRNLIYGGLAAAAGVGGLAAADRLAKRYGLIPPDGSGIYGAGETLTYACQRMITAHMPLREFSRSMISKDPFANEIAPPKDDFRRLEAGGGPLRLRVPRQLGYKSLKFVNHITATDDIRKFGSGRGSVDPDYGYAWYAGI